MKIDISDDTAMSIMADVMVHDYYHLKGDIERHEDRPILSDVEKADLQSWKKAKDGLDIVLVYYLGHEWKKQYA